MTYLGKRTRRSTLQIGAVMLSIGLLAACQTTDGVNVTTSSVSDGTGNTGGGGGGGGDGSADAGTESGTVGKVTDVAAKTGGKVLHVAGSTTLLLAAVIDNTGGQLPAPVGGVVTKVGGAVGTVGGKVGGTGDALRADGLGAIPPVGKTVTVVDGLSAGLLKASVANKTLLGYGSPASNQLVNVSVLNNTAQTGKSGVAAGVLSAGSVAKVSVAGKTLVDIPSGGGTGGGGTGGGSGAGASVGSTAGGLLNKVVSIRN